jgi:ribosomal-protein-alanine N-acetyltransferase
MEMKEFPMLTTPRFDLIDPDIRHAEDVFCYGTDPEFCRYIDAKPFATLSEAENFLTGLRVANARGERLYWSIYDRSIGRVIGTLGFIEVSWRHGVAEFGFGIARTHWGNGVFLECAAPLILFAKNTLGVERLEMRTRADNQNAIRACLKAGLKSFYRPRGIDVRVDAMQMCLFL